MPNSADRSPSVDPSHGTLPQHLSHITSLDDLDAITAAHLEAAFAGVPLAQPPINSETVSDISHIPSSVLSHTVGHLSQDQQEVLLDPTTTVSSEHAQNALLRRYSGSEFNRP